MTLTPDQKGSIAESEIAAAAIRLGIGVFKPLTDGERYDLVFNLRPLLLRVQCKWAPYHGDVVVIRCYSNRRGATGFVKRTYTDVEIDAIAAYCDELDRCYLLPACVFTRHPQVQLRVAQPRNGQRRGVRWAEDFDLAARLHEHSGAVAQLGERCHGMAEVTGSSPVGSITVGSPAAPR